VNRPRRNASLLILYLSLGGLAFAVLIVARTLQGAAGAILPLSIGIVRDGLCPQRFGVTVGLLSAITVGLLLLGISTH
jgi:hypothetical protein